MPWKNDHTPNARYKSEAEANVLCFVRQGDPLLTDTGCYTDVVDLCEKELFRRPALMHHNEDFVAVSHQREPPIAFLDRDSGGQVAKPRHSWERLRLQEHIGEDWCVRGTQQRLHGSSLYFFLFLGFLFRFNGCNVAIFGADHAFLVFRSWLRETHLHPPITRWLRAVWPIHMEPFSLFTFHKELLTGLDPLLERITLQACVERDAVSGVVPY